MEDLKFERSCSKCMSDDVRQLVSALIKATANFKATGKSGTANIPGRGSYTYAKIGDVYEAVLSSLAANNISPLHFTFRDGDKEVLLTRLVHELTGQWIEDSRTLIFEKPGNQGRGAAETYAKKYAMLTLCRIPAEDDDCQEEEKHIEKKGKLASKAAGKIVIPEPQVITEAQCNYLKGLFKLYPLAYREVAAQIDGYKVEGTLIGEYDDIIDVIESVSGKKLS